MTTARSRKSSESMTTRVEPQPAETPEREATPGEELPDAEQQNDVETTPSVALDTYVPNVHECIAKAMGLVHAVGKSGQNKEQGYAFKRIDDFMDAANAAMAAAGVHQTVKVLTRIADDSHSTRGGAIMRWIDLEVRFRFYGPRGDHVDTITWGEGRDSADKATNKALTAAQKYALMYTLMIPTSDIQDADRDSPESPSAGANEQQQREHEQRIERERQARADERARQISTATADPETVAQLRADVIGYADSISVATARRESLLVTWSEAARAGALGCEVRLPESWQQHTNGPATCTLHQLIEGATDVTLPQSDEQSVEAAELPADDPWATQPVETGAQA